MDDSLYTFLDAAPVVRTVTIGGATVPVPGLSAEGITAVLIDLPGLRDMIAQGGKLDADVILGDLPAILQAVPGALAAVLAAGIGRPRDPRALAWAGRLPLSDQLALLEEVKTATLGGDNLGEFIRRVTRLVGGPGGTAPAVAPAPEPAPEPGTSGAS